MGQIGSLDSYVTDEENGTIGDIVPCDVDIEADVLDGVQQEQLKAIIWPLVDALPEEQRQVICQRYKGNKMFKDIGKDMGIIASRVKSIEISALRNMRYSRNANLLRSFLTEEDIYSMGLVGNGAARFNNTWTSSTERAAMKMIK